MLDCNGVFGTNFHVVKTIHSQFLREWERIREDCGGREVEEETERERETERKRQTERERGCFAMPHLWPLLSPQWWLTSSTRIFSLPSGGDPPQACHSVLLATVYTPSSHTHTHTHTHTLTQWDLFIYWYSLPDHKWSDAWLCSLSLVWLSSWSDSENIGPNISQFIPKKGSFWITDLSSESKASRRL